MLCNIFGDVISIYYEEGMLAATYTYDTWGKLLAVTDMTGNDIMGDNDIWTQNSIRYRGYVYDEETKLYYLQARYYDPDTCRFISADNYDVLASSPSTLSEKNLFTYCDCNPISRSDPNGQAFVTLATTVGIMAVGGVIGTGISAATSALTQKIFNNNVNWKSVVVAAGTGFVSGAIGASPLGKTGQIIANGIISGASYVTDCVVNNTDVNPISLITSAGLGMASGKIGGGGANENLVLTNAIDSARKSVAREKRRLLLGNYDYAKKSIDSTVNYIINALSIEAWKFSISYGANDLASNAANSLAGKPADIMINVYNKAKLFFKGFRFFI